MEMKLVKELIEYFDKRIKENAGNADELAGFKKKLEESLNSCVVLTIDKRDFEYWDINPEDISDDELLYVAKHMGRMYVDNYFYEDLKMFHDNYLEDLAKGEC